MVCMTGAQTLAGCMAWSSHQLESGSLSQNEDRAPRDPSQVESRSGLLQTDILLKRLTTGHWVGGSALKGAHTVAHTFFNLTLIGILGHVLSGKDCPNTVRCVAPSGGLCPSDTSIILPSPSLQHQRHHFTGVASVSEVGERG